MERSFDRCNTLELIPRQDTSGEYLVAHKFGISFESYYVTGKLYQKHPPTGEIIASFRAARELVARKFRHYLVLFDPNSYAVFYGCDSSIFGSEYLWIYSRGQTMSIETSEHIKDELRKMGVSLVDLIWTDHLPCLLI
ncbi:uncharacterized protein LOC142335091 isoform X2 [Convolutriloba macropyga]